MSFGITILGADTVSGITTGGREADRGSGARPSVGALIEAAHDDVSRRLGQISEEMARESVGRISALRPDEEDLRALLGASCTSSISTMADVLRHHIPLERIEAPAAAAHYARKLAQRGVPIEALLRAHRLGEGVFLRWWYSAAAGHQPSAELPLELMEHTAKVTTGYTDRVCELLVEIYEDERKLWTQRAATSRAVRVRTVLEDDEMERSTAEALIGYRMQGVHVGIVTWARADDTRALEATVGAIASATGRQPLSVLSAERTLWAWVSGPSSMDIDLDALQAELAQRGTDVYLAVGNPAPNLGGFRASHHEAVNAQRVATVRGKDCARITPFAEVAVSAFLVRDLRASRRWVASVLGGLAVDDAHMAELRRTVLTFLRSGSHLTEAADLLHLHKNTIRYRLRKAEDVRGKQINHGRADLEIALLACEHLGKEVLTRTSR